MQLQQNQAETNRVMQAVCWHLGEGKPAAHNQAPQVAYNQVPQGLPAPQGPPGVFNQAPPGTAEAPAVMQQPILVPYPNSDDEGMKTDGSFELADDGRQ